MHNIRIWSYTHKVLYLPRISSRSPIKDQILKTPMRTAGACDIKCLTIDR